MDGEYMDQRVMKKQMAVFMVGSGEAYENYKKTQEIASQYPNDFHYYNDTFYVRHDRNIQEIYKLKELINKGIIKPQMLLYNTWNTFYPSYILNHHFSVFLQIVSMVAKQTQDKQTKTILQNGKLMVELGCYCQKIVSTDFGKIVENYEPIVKKNGEIEMNQKYFFLDKHVSLYSHIACFIAQYESQQVLVFVRVRDVHGEINKQVSIRDFGARISSQYLQVGLNFNKLKPFLLVKVSNQMKIKLAHNVSFFHEFNLSLLDLKKSLNLAIKYTKMRIQFKTLPNSKLERPIHTYQAVGKRIIDGFCKLVCFSELNKALFNKKQIIPLAAPLLDINHHLMLECVIRLRECCGGFGYLQAAGHAGCIERLTLRASEAQIVEIPENTQILKRLHYYSSTDHMEGFFGETLTKQNIFKQSQIFAVFINICVNMKKSSNSLRKQIYLRHFMYQAAIQILKTTEQFSKLDRNSVWFEALYYSCANYILENSEYINWQYVQKHLPREEYFRGLTEVKNNYLNKLISKISEIEEILQVDHVRNAIIGREDSKAFYDEVLAVSKNNLRNSEQFVSYIRRPIVQFLAENSAKL